MAAAQTDLLIRGAGPVGCTVALALRDSGLNISLLERDGVSVPAFRPIALSYASRLILERVGAWRALSATPIETVRVSQLNGFGRTCLQARDAGVPALGYVVEYAALSAALRAQVKAAGIPSRREACAARCDVHAEGSSDTGEKRYAQDALVALVQFDPPAAATAHERFTPHGPLALLPHAGRYAVIWSMQRGARELAEAPEERFLEELSATAGHRPGTPIAAEGRSVQPLSLRVRNARVQGRSVYIGNAAQTLHPVAGQGLNLGLRDAWELAQVLRESSDPGDAATLARYATLRRLDAQSTIRVTDVLASAFLGQSRLARAGRALAMTALDVLPMPRRFFARRMIYGPSAWP
jgi:2-octaprenyl-6-methoxyphenol hydroxylase